MSKWHNPPTIPQCTEIATDGTLFVLYTCFKLSLLFGTSVFGTVPSKLQTVAAVNACAVISSNHQSHEAGNDVGNKAEKGRIDTVLTHQQNPCHSLQILGEAVRLQKISCFHGIRGKTSLAPASLLQSQVSLASTSSGDCTGTMLFWKTSFFKP